MDAGTGLTVTLDEIPWGIATPNLKLDKDRPVFNGECDARGFGGFL